MTFKALIPAAGEGRRLRPHTHVTPKVLLEVAGKPIIGHIMDRLLTAEPSEVCVVVGDQSDRVEAYLTRQFSECRFRFVRQDDPKGLGDAVYRAHGCFNGEPVLVLLGDTILDFDMSELVGEHSIIGVKEVEDPRRFGVVGVENGVIRELVEKAEHPPSNLAIVGVYFLRDSDRLFRALSSLIDKDQRTRGEFQLTDALQAMIESGTEIRTKRIEHWLDCGTPEALLATNRHLLSRSDYCKPRDGVVLIPPLFVHDTAKIEHSVIGPNVSVGSEARISNSVVRDSIVNRRALLECAVLEGSIIGEASVVREGPRRLNLGGFSQLEAGDKAED